MCVRARLGLGLWLAESWLLWNMVMKGGVYPPTVGYWAVLGRLKPWDPDLSSQQGGRPVAGFLILWDSHPLAVGTSSRTSLLLLLEWAHRYR